MEQKLYSVHDATPKSAVILHAPHGGTHIPPDARGVFIIGEDALAAELLAMTDHRTDSFVEAALDAEPTSAVINHQSRFIVDVERFPGLEEEMNAVGMGVLYTHGSQRQRIRIVPDDRQKTYLDFFRDYSTQFERLVDAALAAHGCAVIIDVHSFPTRPLPYELHSDELRPELCVGYEDFHMGAGLRGRVARAFAAWEQGDNESFHGAYVPLKHYRADPCVHSAMLEIRRDQYMNEATGEINEVRANRIVQSLSELVRLVNAEVGA